MYIYLFCNLFSSCEQMFHCEYVKGRPWSVRNIIKNNNNNNKKYKQYNNKKDNKCLYIVKEK